MRKIVNVKIIAAFMLIATACENGFDDLNTNKTALIRVDPVLMFNGAVINTSYTSGGSGGSVLIYDVGVVQQITTPILGVVSGANFNKENRAAAATLWQNYYPNVIRHTRDVINTTEGFPDRSNLLNMTRIIQAYAFIVLTDTYGDIPYFEGGTGYQEQNFYPTYDRQEVIYPDLIKELKEAVAALDASAKIETADVLYAGDIDKWKKFGNSLLLRAGMRLSKMDPATAEATVQSAFAGGVIALNADNASIKHDANYRNGFGVTLNSTEAANYYLAAPFVDYLKDTEDPRLSAIAVRYVGATSGGDQGIGKPTATTEAAEQVGMPIGTTTTSSVPAGVASYYDFSQVDRARMADVAAPIFLVTAAQSQLLLAEARNRGWITTGSEEDYYNSAVRLQMEELASYGAGSTIATEDIDLYLLNNPYNSGDPLEQINTQYWIASFLNGPEAFANFRRSGYPELTPNTSPGQDISDEFIRRIIYPSSEISVNSTNVNEAIANMGGDRLDTRVWWDKP
jgi:hypothetical protein